MASLPSFPLPPTRGNICLDCGDKGEVHLLIFCRKCQESAVHQSPFDDNINWLCWDCAPTDKNAEPSRKSHRITAKRQKVLKTRYDLKERLKQNKRQVATGNGVVETTRLATKDHLQTADVKTQHNTILEEKNSKFKTQGHYDDNKESTRMDEPTHASESAHPEESSLVLFDKTQTIPDIANNGILGVNDNTKSPEPEEHKIIGLQVPPLAACTEAFYSQKLSEPDHCHVAEPVSDPIWSIMRTLPVEASLVMQFRVADSVSRHYIVLDLNIWGLFYINEECETSLEILAHLSNKASPKSFETATAFSALLDIQVLDKKVVLPKRFRVSPPTAACIALYFFPAHVWVEREFDILLDKIIERDLALKAMIHDVELLIFSSRELPLEHWRHRSKYYLWGVFRQRSNAVVNRQKT